MGIPFTMTMGFLFTATMGNLSTMTLGIQLTISKKNYGRKESLNRQSRNT